MGQLESRTILTPPTPLPTSGDWFILHTRSRQEKVVFADLMAMGIGVFLPLFEEVKRYGRRKIARQKPMFPCYLFLRGTLDDTYRIDRTDRLARIIPVADQRKLEWELVNLHLAITRQAPLDPYPFLKVGIRAEVRSGPFRGLQGVIERRDAKDRILLQVDMLGRAMSLELDGAILEPVDR